MGFLLTRWNKRLVSVATFAIAVLFAFRGLGGFAGSIISGGFEAGLVGWRSLGDGYGTSPWGPTAAHWAIASVVISRGWVIGALWTFSWARRMRGPRRSGGRCARCRDHGRIHCDSLDNWVAIEVGCLQYRATVLKWRIIFQQLINQCSQANANRVLDHRAKARSMQDTSFPYDLTSADDHGRTDIGMVDSIERSCSLGWRDDAGGKTRVEHSRG